MIKVSQNVYNGLEACRVSGAYNMFDYKAVANWCLVNGYDEAYHWIIENGSDYTNGVFYGFYIEDN